MFVETKAGEVQAPAKAMKLSEAIRKGKSLVKETHDDYRFCALGCAWAGVTGRQLLHEDVARISSVGAHREIFAEKLGADMGFDRSICRSVHYKHVASMPALQIADWLEAQGY